MKKSIIAMTIAAAVAAPMSVNAAASVYGAVQAEITQTDSGKANSDATIGMKEWGRGFIGVKGSEEIGNGMTMIGKMEFGVATDEATIHGNRQSYVGLKAGWGTVMMGKIPAPYKYAGGVKYDAFVATSLQARKGITMSAAGQNGAQGHNGFQANTVGFRLMDGALAVNIGASEGEGTLGDINASYKVKMGKGNEIIVAHTSHSQDTDQNTAAVAGSVDLGTGAITVPKAAVTNSAADYTATKVGGKFGAIKAQFETIDADGDKGTFIFAAYSMKAAGGSVVIQGGQKDFDSMADAQTDVTVGYIKKFSKKARWFAGARSTDDGTNNATTITYGMRFDY